MPPPISPTRKPIGPVIKIPSRGPWSEDGLKIIGPKKPRINPILPIIIPPKKIYLNKLFETAAVFFQTTTPMPIAISNDGNDVTIGIVEIICISGITQ